MHGPLSLNPIISTCTGYSIDKIYFQKQETREVACTFEEVPGKLLQSAVEGPELLRELVEYLP